jgi:hypothetical protein
MPSTLLAHKPTRAPGAVRLLTVASAAFLFLSLTPVQASTTAIAQTIHETLPGIDQIKQRARAAAEWTAAIASDGFRPMSRTLPATAIRQSAAAVNQPRSVGARCGVGWAWATHHLRWSNALGKTADVVVGAGNPSQGLPGSVPYGGSYTALEVLHAGTAAEVVQWMHGQEALCRQLMSADHDEYALSRSPAPDGWGRYRWVLLVGKSSADRR